MIDVAKIKYKVILITEDSTKINITKAISALGWEENENELSMRINITLCNRKYKGKMLSSYAKPQCIIGIQASINGKFTEVARGIIVDWDSTYSNGNDMINLTCYDNLYDLQQSQDYAYFPKGTSTKSAIVSLFKKWKYTVDYKGPDVSHSKLIYKNEYIGDMILDILDDATKKGGKKAVVRSEKGKVKILPRGTNTDVYHFDNNNVISVNINKSTSNIVTRVKVVSVSSKSDRAKVEAVLDGKTQYGIRQKIYVRDKDDSLSSAKKAANKILKEDGSVDKRNVITLPDVPIIRKWDKIHLNTRGLSGFYYVKSINHDADSGVMRLKVIIAE